MELGEGLGERGLHGGASSEPRSLLRQRFLRALDRRFGGAFVDVLPLDRHVGQDIDPRLVDGDEAFTDGEVFLLPPLVTTSSPGLICVISGMCMRQHAHFALDGREHDDFHVVAVGDVFRE